MDQFAGEDFTFLIIGLIAVFLNLTEISLILKRYSVMSAFEKLLLSLSVSDLLVASSGAAFSSLSFSDVIKDDILQKYFDSVLVFSMTFSIVSSMAITIDRLFAVRFPLQHKIKMKYRLANTIVASVWLLSIAVISVKAILCFAFEYEIEILFLPFAVTFVVAGFVFALSYGYMFRLVLQMRAKVMMSSNQGCKQTCSIVDVILQKRCKAERHMLLTSCLVVFSFIVLTYPYSIQIFLIPKGPVTFGTKVCLLCTSAVNPVVYFFKDWIERRRQ